MTRDQNLDDNPKIDSRISKYLGFLLTLNLILFASCLLIGSTMIVPQVYYLPELPSFYVAFTSVTSDVHNISGDHVQAKLDVAFVVQNVGESTMSYNNITASVFHGGKLLFDVGSDSLLPFEQYHGNSRNVFVSSDDAKIHVDNWIGTDGGKVGISNLNLELKAITGYSGWYLIEHEIPIKVVCDNVEIQISSNSATTTRRFNPMLFCRVHGRFRKFNIMKATIGGLFGASLLGFVVFGIFALFLAK